MQKLNTVSAIFIIILLTFFSGLSHTPGYSTDVFASDVDQSNCMKTKNGERKNIPTSKRKLRSIGNWGKDIGKKINNVEKLYGDEIKLAAIAHNYDENKIKAIIVVETGGNPKKKIIISSKGCRGPMQLKPSTARSMGIEQHEIDDNFKNIWAGTRYIKELQEKYKSFEIAAAAYNRGPGKVKSSLRKGNFDPNKLTYVKRVKYVLNNL